MCKVYKDIRAGVGVIFKVKGSDFQGDSFIFFDGGNVFRCTPANGVFVPLKSGDPTNLFQLMD